MSATRTQSTTPGKPRHENAVWLDVVIVNYNTRELLDACLRSLANARRPWPGRTYVVDNGSSDSSAAHVRAYFSWVELIEAPRNGGYAYANNLALRPALASLPPDCHHRHCYCLLLNPDTEVAADSLVQTVAFLEAHPEAGAMGPRLLLPDGRLDLACRRLFPTPRRAFYRLTGLSRLFPRSRRLAGYNLTYLDEHVTTEVDSVVGAYMLVRVAAIDDAGLLDEAFFMYGEDLDWAYRIKQAGWSIYYAPVTTVLHHKGAASRKRSTRSILAFYRAMAVFHRKHYAPALPTAANVVILAGIASRGALAVLINAMRPPQGKRVG